MVNIRENRVAKHWLLFEPASSTYGYWREVARESLEETKGTIARGSWTGREAAVSLLADRLQRDITGDCHILTSGSGPYQELIETALDDVDWWSLAEALMDEHAVRASNAARNPLPLVASRGRRHSYGKTPRGGTPSW
jgi:hypothetical protein